VNTMKGFSLDPPWAGCQRQSRWQGERDLAPKSREHGGWWRCADRQFVEECFSELVLASRECEDEFFYPKDFFTVCPHEHRSWLHSWICPWSTTEEAQISEPEEGKDSSMPHTEEVIALDPGHRVTSSRGCVTRDGWFGFARKASQSAIPLGDGSRELCRVSTCLMNLVHHQSSCAACASPTLDFSASAQRITWSGGKGC